MPNVMKSSSTNSTMIAATLILMAWTAKPAQTANGVPLNVKITLVLDKQEFFLGENILLHYCVENTNGPAFSLDVGGDYRGGTRANRFKITATGKSGRAVPDPDPVQWNMGGMSPNSSLTNGSKWYEQVWLVRYCQFDNPGVYSIRVFHDLGWGPKLSPDPREVSTTIKLKQPNEAQARQVVEDMFAALSYSGPTWGKMSNPKADFTALRYPIYMPILLERARGGSMEALEGISSIPTSDATKVLVELLKTPTDRPLTSGGPNWGHRIYLRSGTPATNLLLGAAQCLERRLPQPKPAGSASDPNVLLRAWHSATQTVARSFSGQVDPELYTRTWRSGFADPVRAFALGLLSGTNRDGFLLAIPEMNTVGRKQDLPALLDALNRAVGWTKGAFRGDHGYPEPLSASSRLAEVIEHITAKDRSFQPRLSTPGEALLYARGLPRHAITGQTDWITNSVVLLRSDIPFLRAQTLAHLPRTLPEALAKMLPQMMLDPDVAVQNQAFLLAEKNESPEHRDIALKVLASATDQWLFHAVFRVAMLHGARYECARIWVERFNDKIDQPGPNMPFYAIQALCEIVTGGHISGGFNSQPDTTALKQKWDAFIEEHRDDLKAGRRFAPGDGVMPRELLPAGWQYYTPSPTNLR